LPSTRRPSKSAGSDKFRGSSSSCLMSEAARSPWSWDQRVRDPAGAARPLGHGEACRPREKTEGSGRTFLFIPQEGANIRPVRSL